MIKRVLAIICICVLVSLYIITIVVSIAGDELNMNLLIASFAATIIIPLVMGIIIKGHNSIVKNKQSTNK